MINTFRTKHIVFINVHTFLAQFGGAQTAYSNGMA
jgi:hypothetical protein